MGTPLPTAYEASRNADGTWNVHDVPIFGEVPGKDDDKPALISSEWLRKAVERDARRRAEGYSAPLHIRHNRPGGPTPERAGGLKLNRVGRAKYDGADIDVVFADFERVPDNVYQRMKQGQLPYRSVEILDPRKAEINSCALLDSEVPFFRFPNLSVMTEKPGLKYSARHVKHSPVVGCVLGATQAGGRWSKSPERTYLFHAGVISMDTTSNSPDTTDATPDTPDTGNDDAIENAAARMFSLVETLSDRLDDLTTRFAAMEEAVKQGEDVDRPDITPDVPVTPQDINQDAVDAAAHAGVDPSATPDPAHFSAESAQLHGRLLALEAKLAAQDAEKATEARFSAALEKLDGYQLSDEGRDSLRKFAAMGQEAVDAVVASFQAALPKFPAPTLDSAAKGAAAAVSADDPAVAAYADDPVKLEKARRFSAQYDQLGPRITSTREQFIKFNVENPAARGFADTDDTTE